MNCDLLILTYICFMHAADVPGEGEIKILSYLYEKPFTHSFLLVGGDADLVVLALASLRP